MTTHTENGMKLPLWAIEKICESFEKSEAESRLQYSPENINKTRTENGMKLPLWVIQEICESFGAAETELQFCQEASVMIQFIANGHAHVGNLEEATTEVIKFVCQLKQYYPQREKMNISERTRK